MDFYNFFKGFLGLPNSVPPDDFNSDRYNYDVPPNSDGFFNNGEDVGPEVHIFSSPSEFHKFFEHQMSEVFKSFAMFANEPFGDFFKSGSGIEMLPPAPEEGHKGSLRDQYLKPGFETPSIKGKSDSDLDGKVNINEIDKFLKPEERKSVTEYQKPRSSFYGKSISTRTIMHPDGIIETQKSVKDNAGNEEITITQKRGDQEFTRITKVDPDGKRSTEEKLVNIDPDEVDKFLKGHTNSESILDNYKTPWSFFKPDADGPSGIRSFFKLW